jgi:hypothetical protein
MERRASEWEFPEGIKEHGYWFDLTGRHAFIIYEVEDPKVLLGANHCWTDIAKVKSFPVMDMKDVMELMQTEK